MSAGRFRASLARADALLVGLFVAVALAACSDDGGESGGSEWVGDIGRAVAAVEEELGGPQEYFEVTSTPALTNVFVAIDDGTLAVPYVFVDGRLEPPAPSLPASGNVFVAEAIAFDEGRILSAVEDELPGATVDALSVEGGPGGTVRYVVVVRSDAGGVLDVVVTADGSVLSVTPL